MLYIKFWADDFFPYGILKMLFHYLLVSVVSDENSADIVPVFNVMCHFLLGCFQAFFLPFEFSSITINMTVLGVVSCEFILLGI